MAKLSKSKIAKLKSKLPAPLPNKPKGIDIADIIGLIKTGLSAGQAAKVLRCSKRNIQCRFRKVAEEVEKVGGFKEHRADVLAIHQRRILNSITPFNLQKANLKDKTVAFGVLFDKEKIEVGKGSVGGGIKIEIVNFAGASGGGEGKVAQVTFVQPNAMSENNPEYQQGG